MPADLFRWLSRLLSQHSSGRGLFYAAESGLFGGANDIAYGAIERGILSVIIRSFDGVDETKITQARRPYPFFCDPKPNVLGYPFRAVAVLCD